MKFEFLEPENVDSKMFRRCVKVILKLEEYEDCSKLIIQQKDYKTWVRINLDTINSISKLIKNTEENIKNDNRKKH